MSTDLIIRKKEYKFTVLLYIFLNVYFFINLLIISLYTSKIIGLISIINFYYISFIYTIIILFNIVYYFLFKYYYKKTITNYKILSYIKTNQKCLTYLIIILCITYTNILLLFHLKILHHFISLINIITILTAIILFVYIQNKNNTIMISNLEMRNKTLTELYDETRSFKHDFQNIIQSIGGYIWNNDIKGLEIYYKDIIKDCKSKINLSNFNNNLASNPAIYNIIANKYYIACNNNIDFNLEILLDISTLNVNSYEISRILGILLDNSIEASKECSERFINIIFKQEYKKQCVIIENTFNDNFSIGNIYEKNFSTKKNHSGLGLWKVNQIINNSKNMNLVTQINNNIFLQKIEIFI